MTISTIIEERRAFRALDPAAISNGEILELSRLAGLAPSCFNNQPWRFVFIRDKSQLSRIFETLSRGNQWAIRAGMVIAVVSRRQDDCIIETRDYHLFDTGIASAFLILALTEMGLVAHPIAGFDNNRAKSLLGIPDDSTLITLLIVGKHSPDPDLHLSDKQLQSEVERPRRKASKTIMKLERFD